MAGMFAIFGVSEWTALGPMLVYSLLATAGMVWLGNGLLSTTSGLLAGALMAAVPFTLRSGSLVLADGPVVSWAIIGTAALVAASNAASLLSPRRRAALLALSALAFGAGWLTKASIVAMVPVAGVLLLRHLRRSPTAIADGFLFLGLSTAVLTGEMLAYRISHDAWLYRNVALEATNAQFAHLWDGILTPRRFLIDGPRAMLSPTTFGALPFVSLPIAVLSLVRRRHLALVAWIVYLAIFFNFMSTSLAGYQPIRPVSIYFFLLLVPQTLLIAAFLTFDLPTLLSYASRRWPHLSRSLEPAVVRAVILLVIAGITLLVESRNHSRNSAHLRIVLEQLRRSPETAAVYLENRRHWWGCRLLAGPRDAGHCRLLGASEAPRAGDLLASIGAGHDDVVTMWPDRNPDTELVAKPVLDDPAKWLRIYRFEPALPADDNIERRR